MIQIGYLVGSHVVYNHGALPELLSSMYRVGIDAKKIVVIVNGSSQPHEMNYWGSLFIFRKQEWPPHFAPIVDLDLGTRMGVTHWFYLNCTSRCGPKFKELVEVGFNPDMDATAAGPLIPVNTRGSGGRAINDLCMYRHDYLMSQKEEIHREESATSISQLIVDCEGLLYALAPKQAQYPNHNSYNTLYPPTDIYGTGVPRITEYFGAIDWYRFKKNWGQLGDAYKMAAL